MKELTEITSLTIPELDVYAHLGERELLKLYEPNGGLFIAESPKVIARALAAGYIPESVLIDSSEVKSEAAGLLECMKEIPVYTAKTEILRELTGFHLTRGMLCAMKRRPLPSAAELCGDARRIAVLENVMNPTNVGAIFRSAAAMGMEAVLLTEGCADPLYRRAARVSMGTVFQVPWTFLKNGSGWTGEIRKMGYKTCAMALTDDTIRIDDPRISREARLAVVLGTEGDGLAKATIADCDYRVKIPMKDGIDSLNVAAASAVAFWELTGKLRSED